MDQNKNKKLGKILLENNYITKEQLEKAINKQKHTSKRLGELLIDFGYIEEEDLIEVLKIQLGFKRVKLDRYNLDSTLAKYVPENIARKYNLVPFSLADEDLKIAMRDPSNLEAIDAIKITTGYQIKPYISTLEEIRDAQDFIYSAVNITGSEQPADEEENIPDIDVQQPVSKLTKQLIELAIKKQASDIHIEPDENKIRIRYRIHGVLQEQMTLSRSILNNLISRYKVLADMDVTKNRIPQNGRIKIQIGNYEINSRVSTLPTLHGEKMVIRLLLKDESLLNINSLGFSALNLNRLKQLIEKPYGIILVTGPTSSGKTTTLFASLNFLNNQERNIITIEDPIEYQLQGIYQVQTSTNPDLNFPRALRSVLRQDPDIIMIGEIRDKETAEIAVRAAVTGHLVLSTMHTNDACSAIGRLLSLGVPSYLIHSSLIGVVAQRLVRTLCNCKKEYIPDNSEKEYLGIEIDKDVKFYKTRGCSDCNNTGYMGRTTIQEVLVLDEDFERLIINKAQKQKIENMAKKKGFITLKEHARKKVLDGETTCSEIHRVVL